MTTTLRDLLSRAVADGAVELPNDYMEGATTRIPLEAAVSLWAAHRGRARDTRAAAISPERTSVRVESGDDTRAVVILNGQRYAVDAAGRITVLCIVADCSNACIGTDTLNVCAPHIDHPEITYGVTADDPADLIATRLIIWQGEAKNALEEAETAAARAVAYADRVKAKPDKAVIRQATAPTSPVLS